MNGDTASAEEDLQELFPGFSQLRVPLADGTSMRVVTGGTGPAVLLLHGYPETLCAWHRVAPALAGEFCVVAADLPGYGGSHLSRTSETVVSPSRKAIAAALLEMMDRLGHERFMVVGHDRGARAAYRIAIDAPGRVAAVASLTVIPTIDVWESINGDFALRAPHWFLFAQPADLLEKMLSHDPEGVLEAVLGTMASGLANVDPLAFKDYAIAFGRRDVREAIYRDYKAALEIDLEHERADRLAGIRLQCPVLFLWDERGGGGAELLQIWRRWADEVTGAGIAGGHLQPEMAPEAVLNQLLPFLARCSGQGDLSTRRHASQCAAKRKRPHLWSSSMKTALITGGAGAVGSATARMLAQDGFSIVLVDIAIEPAMAVCEAIRRDFGVEATAEYTDLSDLSSLRPLLEKVGRNSGRLDCLVNNAGRTGAPTIGEVDLAAWDAVLTVNLTAPMLLCQEAVPLLRASGGGSIINVASRVYLSGTGIGYTSSKSGLIGLTRALAVQLGRDNIRVNAVAPSFLNSPFNKGLVEQNSSLADSFRRITPLGRLGTPEDVAGAIAFLASDRAAFITGDTLHVCGGTQLAPQPV